MGKRILVITGSPRKEGNSEMMADAFIKGARESGHDPDKFEAAFHKIDGCKACRTCWSKGLPCSYDDDFNYKLAPLLEQAEAIVFSVPLYFFSFPTQIKAALDRLYPYVPHIVKHGGRKLKISESALLLCGGYKEEQVYGGVVESYRQIAAYLGWKDREILVVPGVNRKGDVLQTDGLKKAEELGKSF